MFWREPELCRQTKIGQTSNKHPNCLAPRKLPPPNDHEIVISAQWRSVTITKIGDSKCKYFLMVIFELTISNFCSVALVCIIMTIVIKKKYFIFDNDHYHFNCSADVGNTTEPLCCHEGGCDSACPLALGVCVRGSRGYICSLAWVSTTNTNS